MNKDEPAPAKKSRMPLIIALIIILAAAVGFGAWMGISRANRKAEAERKAAKIAEFEKDEAARTSAADRSGAEGTGTNAAGQNGSGTGTNTANQNGTDTTATTPGLARSEDQLNKTIYYKGKQYTLRDDLTTVLFMGVDDTEDTEHHEILTNGGRSDTLILFILDDATKTAEMLDISRDTITEVDVYDENGDFLYSSDMQITLQYAFGESRLKSCWLTKRTVSELLYGTQIDAFLSLTMDGIERIVDILGGLTVTMPKDYSYIDPAYTEGAEIKLDGAAAERFVRYRDIEKLGSNNERMERQSWFMKQFLATLKKAPDMGALLDSLLDKAKTYVETDMSGEQIKALGSYSLADELITLPGKDKEGYHDEFYVDDEALQDLLVQLFYVPSN